MLACGELSREEWISLSEGVVLHHPGELSLTEAQSMLALLYWVVMASVPFEVIATSQVQDYVSFNGVVALWFKLSAGDVDESSDTLFHPI